MHSVTVKTFDNYFSANIMLGRLRNEGINCYLLDENTATIYPVIANAIGGIKLAVEVNDAQQAMTLMDMYEQEYLLSVACPQCSGNNITQVSKPGAGNFITTIFTWLFSNYAIAPEKIYQCQDCRFESISLPVNNAEQN